MIRKRTITVIGSISSSPFIVSDIHLLERDNTVYTVDITGKLNTSKFPRIYQYLQTGLNIIFNACPKICISDGVLIWFADVHAVIPMLLCKLLRKQCVISIGGFEVCNMPEINYGMMRNPTHWRTKICKWIIRNADICIVPSPSYFDKTLPYVTDANKIRIIPDCVEYDIPLSLRYYNKQNIVLMVARADKGSYLLKGIPAFNDAASKIRDASFYVIGIYDESIKNQYPNINYLGLLSHDAVMYWMNISKVYCQLSKTESFGVSVMEAMSAGGCIPVVTNTDSLTELVGNHGYIVRDSYDKIIPQAIKLSLLSSSFNLHRKISSDATEKIKGFCKVRYKAFKDLFGD